MSAQQTKGAVVFKEIAQAVMAELEHALESCFYTCGCMIQDFDAFSNFLCQELCEKQLTMISCCGNAVLFMYYSCKLFENVCIHCGILDGLVTEDNIYPTCEDCIQGHPKTYKHEHSRMTSVSAAKKQIVH